jgi:hypothetical protein
LTDQFARVCLVKSKRKIPHCNQRIERAQTVRGDGSLVTTDIGRGEDRLPLKVRLVHRIVVHDSDGSNPGSRQVLQSWGTQSAGSYHEDARPGESLLTAQSDLGNQQVPAVTPQLSSVQVRIPPRAPARGAARRATAVRLRASVRRHTCDRSRPSRTPLAPVPGRRAP